MGFGGVPVSAFVGTGHLILEVSGGTLGPVTGPFVAVAPDAAELSTGAPGPGVFVLPTNFGPGTGNWVAADAIAVAVDIHDLNGLPVPSDVRLVAKSVVAGNLIIDIHNKTAAVATAVLVRLRFEHSLPR